MERLLRLDQRHQYGRDTPVAPVLWYVYDMARLVGHFRLHSVQRQPSAQQLLLYYAQLIWEVVPLIDGAVLASGAVGIMFLSAFSFIVRGRAR